MINGANARSLCRFTGKDTHQEASARTRSYDLIKAIKQRRFKWLGHLLRMRGDRLVKLAVRVQFARGQDGGFFVDLPYHLSLEEIEELAQERKIWKRLSTHVGDTEAMARCVQHAQTQKSCNTTATTTANTTATTIATNLTATTVTTHLTPI